MPTQPPTTPDGERQVFFNAFDMNCVGHQSPGLWRHPEDRSREYRSLDYWVGLARTLEEGLFESLFIADVLGPYDVYEGSPRAALRSGAQVPVNDPILLVPAMAAATKNLGFGVTAGTAYEHPYPFSRRLATLDHLSDGRVGWNVVTGHLPSAARNLGEADQREHDERYDHADEYLDVIYQLLGGSWEDDAVADDPTTGVFTHPDKVHDIGHRGRFFTVPGAAIVEPSPQRVPLIFQAGASPRGQRFAGRHAEASFINSPTDALAKKATANLRAAAVAAGREPYDIRVFTLITVVTGKTDAEAKEKLEELASYVDIEGALALLSGWLGVDLARFDPDEPLGDVESNAIRSTVANFQALAGDDKERTVRRIAKWAGIGGVGRVLVGSGETVARELARIQDETDVDGFNLAYHITPGTFEDLVEHVVPALQDLGRYKTEYRPGTLRNKLFGEGDRLSPRHYGARFAPSARPAAAG